MNYAQIIVRCKPIGKDRCQDTYEWKGKPSDPILISDAIDWDRLPFPLKKIEYRAWERSWLCIRTDVSFWWITSIKTKAQNAWHWFFDRLIYTLEIWGLAYVPLGAIPSWKHIGWKRP